MFVAVGAFEEVDDGAGSAVCSCEFVEDSELDLFECVFTSEFVGAGFSAFVIEFLLGFFAASVGRPSPPVYFFFLRLRVVDGAVL